MSPQMSLALVTAMVIKLHDKHILYSQIGLSLNYALLLKNCVQLVELLIVFGTLKRIFKVG
jgi:hypothetical protein